jgi:hypothetical protein
MDRSLLTHRSDISQSKRVVAFLLEDVSHAELAIGNVINNFVLGLDTIEILTGGQCQFVASSA